MKKIFSTLVAVFAIIHFSYGQWTSGGGGNYYLTSGNASIGTATATTKLTVAGDMNVSGGTFYIQNTSPYFRVQDPSVGTDLKWWDIYTNSGTLNFRFINDGYSAANNWLTVTRTGYMPTSVSFPNGNFGIGTTSPTEKLVVNGNIQSILSSSTFPAKNVSSVISLGFSGITGAQNWAIRGVYQYGLGVSHNADGGDLDIIKSLDGNTILATKTDGSILGSVGIGTTNPQGYMLAVNGSAIATSMTVKLYANWPDYVFKKSYTLPSLTEVKTYIDKNQHLPDMPSAQDVAKNGLDIGETDKLLTKKVEELTLYLIEKDRQIDQQEKRLKKIEGKLNALNTKHKKTTTK